MTWTSSNRSVTTWTAGVTLVFETNSESGDLEISPADGASTGGVESADVVVTPGFPSDCAGFQPSLRDSTQFVFPYVVMGRVGFPLCAAPGPEYLGLCPLES